MGRLDRRLAVELYRFAISGGPLHGRSRNLPVWLFGNCREAASTGADGFAIAAGKMLYSLIRPALFALDAERAHGLALAALKLLPDTK